jgi:hypothetical protein
MVMLYITHLPNPAVVHGINWSPKTHLGTLGSKLGGKSLDNEAPQQLKK